MLGFVKGVILIYGGYIDTARLIFIMASLNEYASLGYNDLTSGYQTSNSASSSKFHHWPLLALLVALVLH